ncbi:MAG: hypothetical protein IJP77_06050 [Bacteroidales bacterium]|nr:hypothetical protein [Bacteroidales bacterium]
MKIIKSTTKNGARFVAAFRLSSARSLSDCYGRYSTGKACAERECRAKMDAENGEDFRITSYNTFGFSCGWRSSAGLRIETPSASYLVI